MVQAKLRPQVVVSDSDIDSYLERMMANTGKPEYLLSEIFLPVENPGEEAQTRQLAQKLAQEIRSGKAAFFKVAQQFSKSAGAPQGGDLGWISQGQLQQELDDVLPRIEKGRVSNPIRTSSGFHILEVRDQRVVAPENLPAREEVMGMLGLQRLERLQRRYLLDLKSAAFIENRLGG
ncbi:MAG: peptidylprolyl isomerase [Alphaproteobacteria bacterium]